MFCPFKLHVSRRLFYFLFLSGTQCLFHPVFFLFLCQNALVTVILSLLSLSFPCTPSFSFHLISVSFFPLNFTGDKDVTLLCLVIGCEGLQRDRQGLYFCLSCLILCFSSLVSSRFLHLLFPSLLSFHPLLSSSFLSFLLPLSPLFFPPLSFCFISSSTLSVGVK